MSKYIDVKQTCWFRYELHDDVELGPIIEELKKGQQIDTVLNGVYPELWDEEKVKFDVLIETEHFITPAENHGDCTIEVYDSAEFDRTEHPAYELPEPIFTNKEINYNSPTKPISL